MVGCAITNAIGEDRFSYKIGSSRGKTKRMEIKPEAVLAVMSGGTW